MITPGRLCFSVPPAMRDAFGACESRLAREAFVTADPDGQRLGSGGGTAHVLVEAWRADAGGRTFADWLVEGGVCTVAHGGGQGRRLPAYAGCGKLCMPMPVTRWATGQRLDQTLFDLQDRFLDRVRDACAPSARVLLASGDVLVHAGSALPPLPDADVVLVGLWERPETARRFGVMFCERSDPTRLMTFRQKPSVAEIGALPRDQVFMLDAGVWLLSARAVEVLMRRAGWDAASQRFEAGIPNPLDLYGDWGPALGVRPARPDAEISALTAAVALVEDGCFFHFGRSRDIIDSAHELQNLVIDQTQLGGVSAHPRRFVLNARFDGTGCADSLADVWIENSVVGSGWRLTGGHVLTGIPPNDWQLAIEPGVCIDVAPLDADASALRVYGIDDTFRGPLGAPDTCWMGRAVTDWLAARGLMFETAGLDPASDIYEAPLFPVVDGDAGRVDPAWLEWLTATCPSGDFATAWCEARRVSAATLCDQVDLRRLYAQREILRGDALRRLAARGSAGIFYRLDLEAAADALATGPEGAIDEGPGVDSITEPLDAAYDCMFRSTLAVYRGKHDAAAAYECDAFAALREAIDRPLRGRPVMPACHVLVDQIVWARAPARIDLAGGWSDTPPYCMRHGGAVLNMAVDLNGQPPIQAFVRRCEARHIVIRSIDLGIEDRFDTYPELTPNVGPNGGFGIARTALALSGFHPAFNGGAFDSLDAQLRAFGGGIELTLLAAVPKGSGLGTSSILGGTVLGALAVFCGLDWDTGEIVRRTLALEQLLGSGGGWQDQVGGLQPGIKLVQTRPGLVQEPESHWLPQAWLEAPETAGRFLLYYTGITRTARSILAGIVRGMFLNLGSQLELIDAIKANAGQCAGAMIRGDADAVARAIARSWTLNQRLDSGTNVPAVRELLDRCGSRLSAAKLAGAGGGGYLLLMARSVADAAAIRAELEANPPNAGARFVNMTLSHTGLQVTRS